MKVLLVLTTVFFLVLLGCQENAVNPVETSSILKDRPVIQKTIELRYEIKYLNSNVYNLSGRANYVLEVIPDMMTPRATTYRSLSINFHGMLCNKLAMRPCLFSVEGKSNDVVQVSEEGILLIDKYYPITNRNDIVLKVKYLVTTEGVGISRVELIPAEQIITERY